MGGLVVDNCFHFYSRKKIRISAKIFPYHSAWYSTNRSNMCGIAGYTTFNTNTTDPSVISLMLNKLKHRGPNDTGIWQENSISMGATRLSIMDLSDGGNQPFITSDKSGVLVYNGEVYNHNELRAELKSEFKNIPFRSTCDTETVLYALHMWGAEKAIDKFNGMFAFAYFDQRTGDLWLGRDRAGIKPIYYSRVNDEFLFGSEIKVLLEHPFINPRADLHALTTYIVEKRLDRWTPFEQITELEPGSLLRISNGKMEQITYYDPVQNLDVDRLLSNGRFSPEHWMTSFEELFPHCVESHLASDAPLAVMCSGGVDSSLIAAYAKAYDQNIVAYVAELEGYVPNEKERSQRICDHLGIELRVVPVTRNDFLRLWPLAVFHNDEPLYFKQNIAHMAVAEAVHNDGFKVLVCGEGADELFGGYSWQANTHRIWQIILRRNKILSYLGPLAKYVRRFTATQSFKEIKKQMQEPFLSVEGINSSKLESRYLPVIDGGKRVLRQRDIFKKLEPLGNPAEQAFLTRAIEDYYVHMGTALKSNDKMNMAFSVESRVPYLDKRLIDFAAHLPFKTKFNNGISKPLLKKSASKRLPEDLMYVKKIGFGIPHEMTNNTSSILKNGHIEEMFKWSRKYRDEIIDTIEKDSFSSFHFVSAELWARLYFGGETSEELTEILMNNES
jgi:asparagine synthase (glutamine-hydrolysing)